MMQELSFASSHRIYYSNETPIPVGDIAKSLLALEKIILSSTKALEGVTSVEIDSVKVYVSKIETGSLIEDVIVKVFFKDSENMNAFLDKIGEKVREPGMPRNLVIGAVIATVIGSGAFFASKLVSGGGQTTITANNNTIINFGAGQVEMTPEAFKAVVETAIKNKKELAENTVRFFAPARADSSAAITIDGNDSMQFPANVIAATPMAVKVEKQDYVEDLSDVDLEIRATDLDSTTKGWAGVIHGKIERRVKLKLGAGVTPHDIDRFKVRADVSIVYKRKAKGSGSELVPDHILVREVIKEAAITAR